MGSGSWEPFGEDKRMETHPEELHYRRLGLADSRPVSLTPGEPPPERPRAWNSPPVDYPLGDPWAGQGDADMMNAQRRWEKNRGPEVFTEGQDVRSRESPFLNGMRLADPRMNIIGTAGGIDPGIEKKAPDELRSLADDLLEILRSRGYEPPRGYGQRI